MIGWLAFYVGLSVVTCSALWPMLRAPRAPAVIVPALLYFAVPDATYDSEGLT